MNKINKEHIGSDFDEFLKSEGMLEEAEAIATKRIIAFPIAQKMERTQGFDSAQAE